VLADEPSAEAVQAARGHLDAARAALATLAEERAADGRRPDGHPPPEPALVRRLEIENGDLAPMLARTFCRETCAAWSVPSGLAASLVDVASELVSNAAQHATSPLVLSLEMRTDGVLVSVWDDAAGRPRLLPYHPGRSDRGIGLRLVRRLSREWGWTDDQDGKWVWALLAPPAEL
jgi:anti-sigma regulatory factor (Ser/Thr protein kinase)